MAETGGVFHDPLCHPYRPRVIQSLRWGRGRPINRSNLRITCCSLARSLAAAAGNQVMMENDRMDYDGHVKLDHEVCRTSEFPQLSEEVQPPSLGKLWYSAPRRRLLRSSCAFASLWVKRGGALLRSVHVSVIRWHQVMNAIFQHVTGFSIEPVFSSEPKSSDRRGEEIWLR